MDHHAWDERYASSELIWTATPNRFLVAEVAGLAPGRALDFACGEGRNAVWLATQGWDVTGVDFSSGGLDKARQLAHERGVAVEWILADVTTYRPPSAVFDLVVVLYLQLAAEPLAMALDHAVSALAPGGTLVVVGHDVANLTDGSGGPQDPTVLYTPDQVVSSLDGLTIDKAERVRRPVQTDRGTIDAIDALVRADRPRSPHPTQRQARQEADDAQRPPTAGSPASPISSSSVSTRPRR
jgi:SAM-dependent methyltransferase